MLKFYVASPTIGVFFVVKVNIIPLNKTIKIKKFMNLGKALQELDFELPCGGEGTCGKCLVRIIDKKLSIKAADRKFIPQEKIDKGWRLACQHHVDQNITVELDQWELDIKKEIIRNKAAQYSGGIWNCY